MRPITFPEQNVELQKPGSMSDEECGPLPVFRDGRQCISCWRPNLRERLSILFFGRVWVHVIMGNTQPPIALQGAKTVFVYPKPEPGKTGRWGFRFPFK